MMEFKNIKKENYFNYKKFIYICLNIKEYYYCENKK